MRYRIIFLVFFLLAALLNCCAQNKKEKYELDGGDVYVIKVKFEKKIISDNCSCTYMKSNNCTLYKIQVDSVLYCPRNTFSDSNQLKNSIQFSKSVFLQNQFNRKVE